MHKRYSISEKLELLEKWLRSRDRLQQGERLLLQKANERECEAHWCLLVESNLLVSENDVEHVYFKFSHGNTRESAVEDGLNVLNQSYIKDDGKVNQSYIKDVGKEHQMSWQMIELQLTIEGLI